MDLTRQFVTSYAMMGRGGYPVVGGFVPGGPGLHNSVVATPSARGSSPGGDSTSPEERRRGSGLSPRAPVGCIQPAALSQTTQLATPTTPLNAGLFSPTDGPHMSKHLG